VPQDVLAVEARWVSNTDLVIGNFLVLIVTRCKATMVPCERLVVVDVLEVMKRVNICNIVSVIQFSYKGGG
jgi:hypothetical protein